MLLPLYDPDHYKQLIRGRTPSLHDDVRDNVSYSHCDVTFVLTLLSDSGSMWSDDVLNTNSDKEQRTGLLILLHLHTSFKLLDDSTSPPTVCQQNCSSEKNSCFLFS
uniref:Uncharacterized protein n=1 Tax=Seriola dumerili TaxID=41447 RepID=A0A3B4VQJ0_SERDU